MRTFRIAALSAVVYFSFILIASLAERVTFTVLILRSVLGTLILASETLLLAFLYASFSGQKERAGTAEQEENDGVAAPSFMEGEAGDGLSAMAGESPFGIEDTAEPKDAGSVSGGTEGLPKNVTPETAAKGVRSLLREDDAK